jgi:hypothetical protein
MDAEMLLSDGAQAGQKPPPECIARMIAGPGGLPDDAGLQEKTGPTCRSGLSCPPCRGVQVLRQAGHPARLRARPSPGRVEHSISCATRNIPSSAPGMTRISGGPHWHNRRWVCSPTAPWSGVGLALDLRPC